MVSVACKPAFPLGRRQRFDGAALNVVGALADCLLTHRGKDRRFAETLGSLAVVQMRGMDAGPHVLPSDSRIDKVDMTMAEGSDRLFEAGG